ncbi:hypothetical protein HXX76_013238 [Chlamydomonas incerta]|uniref:Cytochrome P450 n=1 Tax=Chlamydomonas incerta TaxID=51695 RepID=A0A835SM83_CHLIN|nr:hypothetical protein HXX76_013238 [Chlamydomonas incerta]|eukprot:KAG2426048.1 hypothetical protein HXX76_013238 [Chlamydomonas incerta]
MEKYGRVYKIWFGVNPWIVISDPALLRKLAHRCVGKPASMSEYGHVLTGANYEIEQANAFVASGAVWRRGRRVFEASVIHPASLAAHLPAINRCANRFVARLAQRAAAPAGQSGGANGGTDGGGGGGAEEFDFFAAVGGYTMAVVGEVAYGVDFGTMGEDSGSGSEAAGPAADGAAVSSIGQQLQDAAMTSFRCLQVENATKYLPLRVMFPAARPLVRWLATHLPDRAQREHMAARTQIAQVSRRLMERWQANKAAAAAEGGGAGAGGVSGEGDKGGFKEVGGGISSSSFMAAMMEGRRGAPQEERLSDVEVIAQSFLFVLAGFETTADTLALTCYLLATHPEAAARLTAEVDAVGGRELTAEVLAESLPYTEAVLKESMRLYPPLPYLLREAREDLDLGNGMVAPKDAYLILYVHSMHLNPDVWPHPERFLPERFLPEGAAAFGPADPGAWAPFGIGARMCVGHKLAMMVAKCLLVRMYQRFSVALHPRQPLPLRMKAGLSRVPLDGVWLTLTERGSALRAA